MRSGAAWSEVAGNFRADWQMLYREIAIGFLLAGFAAQLHNAFFNGLFLSHSPPIVQSLWGALIGPAIAVLSFVCSIGNVPLAAVLWSGGISFAGVMAFIFADLIILPILNVYRRYYGPRFAIRIAALMFVTMVTTALVIDGLFHLLGLVPSGARPTRAAIFSSTGLNDTLVLNVLAVAVFAALLWLTARRGVTDPVCGMQVDRDKAVTLTLDGVTHRFCSEHCRHAFQTVPERRHDTA